MGWFFVTIYSPVAVPAAFMLLAHAANLPPAVASRTSLLSLFQAGQLGWLALSFSAACAHEVFSHLLQGPRNSPIEPWLPAAMVFSVMLIAASGFLSALGVLYPGGQRRILLVVTSACAGGAASLYSVVHFYLPVP